MSVQSSPKESQRWLVDTVQTQDRDRYLCSMFLPQEHRHSVLCILAFHAEISRIRETVTEPAMGYIRLQWWRDSLEQQNAVLGSSPIVRAVLALPMLEELRPYLFQILEARHRDMERERFGSVSIAENWVDFTTEPLVKALACAVNASDLADSVALHQAAKAHGLVGLLRSSKAFIDIGRPLWSQSLETPAERKDLAQKVLKRIEAAMQIAERHQTEVPASAFALLMPAKIAEQHIQALRHERYEIFAPKFIGPSRVTLRLLWSWVRHRI